jgi:hypothetical protein
MSGAPAAAYTCRCGPCRRAHGGCPRACPRVGFHRHPVYPGRRLPPQPPERPFERPDVYVVQQCREPGLARPAGRVVHPNEMIWKIVPTLRSALQFLVQVPHQSGPSLRSTRCLRRHPQYYAPIRHPAGHSLLPLVFPRQASPPVTYWSNRQDFSGSHDFPVHMIWSPTPAVRRSLAMSVTTVLPSAI